MIPCRPRPPRLIALSFAVAVAVACWPAARGARAGTLPGGFTVRATGRAPIEGGRVDTAYQRALDEAFRHGLLDALRNIAPERQRPQDLELWQETVLTRAGDFVGAWRILAEEQRDGFLTLEAEVEIWREKLARAARAGASPASAAAVRVVVFVGSLALKDPAADEEVDAGRTAAAAIEAELARRGAVIVANAGRAPWEGLAGASSEENRSALAAAAAKRLDADATVIAQLARRGDGLALTADLVATASETTLATARAVVALSADASLAESFAPAARQVAAACAPHLAAARSRARRPPEP